MSMNILATYRAPVSVNIEITEKCNVGCFFCFNAEKDYINAMPDTPTASRFDSLTAILQTLAEHEIFEVRWFGGEFMMMTRWRELMKLAKELGFFQSFVSNGTIMKPEDIEVMSEIGITNGTISMHGPEEINDKIMQRPGSYKRAIANVDRMIAAGINVSISFTPNRSNLTVFESFGRYIVGEHGVSSYGANRLFHSERYENLGLKDYLYILERIAAMQNDGVPAFFIDAFPLCAVPTKYWQYIGGCSQGVTFAQIDYAGNIRNCSGLSVSVGNILSDDLREIWQERLKESRQLGHLPLSCRMCPHFCGGGCIASRGTSENFLPDEFLHRPEEEPFLYSIAKTAYNYVRLGKTLLQQRRMPTPKLHLSPATKLSVKRAFKIREEKPGQHTCMVESRGLVHLNDRGRALLMSIDGERTAQEVLDAACANCGESLQFYELEEIAALVG
jgi:radical SAM protein with 4Fe4S-binding SPASM domain